MTGTTATFTELVAPPPQGRVYEEGVRAGLGDSAPTGRVRLDAIARWLQDVAHADVIDAELDGVALWVVRRTRLQVLRFPRLGERLRVSTFCSATGRMWAERRTTVHAGETLVESVALWVHLDPASGRPTPFTASEHEVYAASANGRVVKARLRQPAPDPDAERCSWTFRETDLDVAGHVNNSAYWGPVDAGLIGATDPPAIDAEMEFRTPAQPGEVIVLRTGGAFWIAAPDGEVYASAQVG